MSGNGSVGGAGSREPLGGGAAAADNTLAQWSGSSPVLKGLVLLIWLSPATALVTARQGMPGWLSLLAALACGLVPAWYLFATAPATARGALRGAAPVLVPKAGACLFSALAVGVVIEGEYASFLGFWFLVAAVFCAANTHAAYQRRRPERTAQEERNAQAVARALRAPVRDAIPVSRDGDAGQTGAGEPADAVPIPASEAERSSASSPAQTPPPRPSPHLTPAAEQRAHHARVYLGVLLADLLIMAGAFVAAILVGFQSWGVSDPQYPQNVAWTQQSQTVAVAAVACAGLALVAYLAWKKRVAGAALFQGLLIIIVLCVAGSAAVRYHHEQHQTGGTQRQQSVDPHQDWTCSNGSCSPPGG